jgi:PAS domain S-box-containing protein
VDTAGKERDPQGARKYDWIRKGRCISMEKKRIMVVEDEGLVGLAIKEGLEALGYEVPVVVPSGDEAIRQVMEHEIDLIMMDIRLKGGIDGIETAQQIRRMLDIPVIYLTAYSDPQTLGRAKITEPFGYILKPVEERSMQAAIEMALHKSQVEKRIKMSNNRLTAILRSMPEGVIIVDVKCRVDFFNPAAELLTGWRKEEAIGRQLQEVFRLLNGKTRSEIQIPVTRSILDGKILRLENCLLITRDKREIPVDCSLAPYKNERGTISGIIDVIQDISDRKKNQAMVERELTSTAEVQLSQLPPRSYSLLGIKADWVFYPSSFGAGDTFNLVQLDAFHVGFFLLDVMGHGFTTALLSTSLHRILSPDIEKGGILKRLLPYSPYLEIIQPVDLIKKLNQRFYVEEDNNPFFTIIYGIIDTRTGETKIARAGHPFPIRQSRKGGGISIIDTGGYAIGIFAEITMQESTFTMEKGDRLFLYSDGLLECANDEMKRFSMEYLIQFVREMAHKPLQEVIQELENQILNWRGKNQFEDDISLLALERE